MTLEIILIPKPSKGNIRRENYQLKLLMKIWHNLLYGALWHSRRMRWEDGWGGGGIQEWRDTCMPMADSCWCLVKPSQYYKVIIIYGFSSSHIWMWELDSEESWALKNWCFWTLGLEKTLESPLDCKEIQPVHPKGYQSWVFIGRTDVEAETPILWPPHVKSLLIGKYHNAGKDWGQEENGMTEDEMAAWLSLTRWTRVWVDSRNWWWTGRPGVLRFMGS